MNKSRKRQIEIHAHWAGLAHPTLVRILHVTPSRGKEIFSFEYDYDWLISSHAQSIDPTLQLFQGQWHAPASQDNFGVFLDSLGGARPKASVLDQQKHLWIAKFPSGNDEYDIGAWEMVSYKLAKFAGSLCLMQK